MEKRQNVEEVTWLNAEQAVEYLSLTSKKTLYMAVWRKQIPKHKMGGRLLFNRRELDEYLMKG